jgi:hypothetical protein
MIPQERVRELFEYRKGVLFWRIKPSQAVNAGEPAG